MFNALKYTEELEKAGFSKNEAETSIKVLIEVMNENFATKTDLLSVKTELQGNMRDLEHRIDSRFQVLSQYVESRFQSADSRLQEFEYKLTIKLGTMMALHIGLTATLITLLK